MYLHYYHNYMHCGQVDSDLVFNYPKDRKFVVVAHNQEQHDMLNAFKLVHGKDIPVLSLHEAGALYLKGKLPVEVFVTKKMGSNLEFGMAV